MADILGGIVRLAFHDAGTFDAASGTGGADGCVELGAAANRGLEPIVGVLEPAVSAVQGTLSRADVWALAAGMAIELAGGPNLEFRVGRIDRDACVGDASRLPSAQGDRAHIVDVFVTKLGFSERETAALMGAHVLGRAVQANSGYNGPWVPNSDRFSNDYFRDLLARPWDLRSRPNFDGEARTQWNGPAGTMMLSTDIALAFDTSGGCTRAGGRGGGGCPRAAGGLSAAVTEFAGGGGQPLFFEAFAQAFAKLMGLGSGALACAWPDCRTPDAV